MAVRNKDMEGNGRVTRDPRSSTPSLQGHHETNGNVPNGTNNPHDYSCRALNYKQRFSYGVGHVLNDLTASMWFSYLLVFFHQVNKFENILAGNLMLIGQVSDALFTPFIGFESDRTNGLWKIGKRKTWHLLGTTCVLASFAFLFNKCITCSSAPNLAQFVYYAPFVVIFQFGWASTQISHLSFSSELTPYKHERVTLQSIRNLFTVVSNLSVYGIFFLLFYFGGDGMDDGDLGPQDAPKFRNLAFICLGTGTVFNVIFYLGTKEKSGDDTLDLEKSGVKGDSSIEKSTLLKSKMKWKDWLKEHQFYQIAVLYMSTRLYINVSQVYFPMYLTETVGFSKSSIALLPLVTYFSSFLMSFLAPFINRFLGRKASYALGAWIGIGSSVWLYFVGKRDYQVYGCAAFMGSSGSLILITSLSMTSDLISENTESGAFVFGAMSFTDKLSNGIAVLLIQKFHPCVGCCPACEPYYRHVQSFIPGAALVLGFIALLTLVPQNIGVRKKDSATKVLTSVVGSYSGTNGSLTNNVQCTCGQFYVPPSSCSVCGAPPSLLSHSAEVHRHYSTDEDEQSDEDSVSNERKPLLRGTSINTPEKDVTMYTENGSVPHSPDV